MEYTSITFGIDVLISVVFGAGGALAVWFKLKGTVNIQQVEMKNLKSALSETKQDIKDKTIQVHKRVDGLKILVDKNQETTTAGVQKMTTNMNEMELRIIKAIHEMK